MNITQYLANLAEEEIKKKKKDLEAIRKGDFKALAKTATKKATETKIPISTLLPGLSALNALPQKVQPTVSLKQIGNKLPENAPAKKLFQGDIKGALAQLNTNLAEGERVTSEGFRARSELNRNKNLTPQKKKELQSKWEASVNQELTKIPMVGLGKSAFTKQQVNMVKSGFTKEVRDRIGQFAQMVEENPNAARRNLGPVGDYVQSVGESLFGQRAANLNNKQLLNAFDSIQEQAFRTKGNPRFSVGLSTQNVRDVNQPKPVQKSKIFDYLLNPKRLEEMTRSPSTQEEAEMIKRWSSVIKSPRSVEKIDRYIAGEKELLLSAKEKAVADEMSLFAKKFPNAPQDLRSGRGYTNVKEIDNPLVYGKSWKSIQEGNSKWLDEPLPWETPKTPVEKAEKMAEFERRSLQPQELPNFDLKINRLQKALNSRLSPISNAPKEVQDIVQNWRTSLLTARVRATQEADLFAHIPEGKEGFKFIEYVQNPTEQNAARLGIDPTKYSEDITNIRNYYDDIRKEGVQKGLDIGYLSNYLNQVWKESPDKIAEKLRGLGRSPAFTKQREIPSYDEGIALGLTPRYSHPAQLAAHYRYALDKAMAGRKLAEDLKRSGVLVSSDAAPVGYKPLDTPLINDLKGFSAPKDVAQALNNMFSLDEGGIMEFGANVSKFMQDVTLSGGVRTLNAFSLGNMIKDMTAGRIVSPVTSFFRSFSDDATRSYFAKNSKYVQMMAEEGVPNYSNYDYEKAFKNIFDDKSIKQRLGNIWTENINDPTFRRFLPNLQMNFFKDTFESAVKDGTSEIAARQLAAKATKNFYGITDDFTRAKFSQDVLSGLFFAPKFRETMINFWINNVKGVKNFKDPAYQANRRFLVGTVLTYVMYDQVNKRFTGKHMWENKEGKEFSVEIPRPGGRSWFVPMLPSVGTLPRRALEALSHAKEGDVAGVMQKFGSFLSQPISLGTQLASNRTFYGGPIYDDDDTSFEKVAKLLGYAGGQASHPFIGEPIEVAQGRKTPTEGVLGAMELPVYPSRSSDLADLHPSQYKKYKGIAATDEKAADEYAETSKRVNQLKKEQREETGDSNFSQSEIVYAQIMEMPNEDEADRKLQEIAETNPALFRAINEVARDQKLGITEEEKIIRSLGVQNGERARRLVQVFAGLKSEKEKDALFDEYWEKRIITDDVLPQLQQYRKKGKF